MATTCLLGSLCLPFAAARADDLSLGGIDGSITGSVGLRNISAAEFMFEGSTLTERLDVKVNNAVNVKAEVIANVSKGWALKAEFSAAFLGQADALERSYYQPHSNQSGPESWDSKYFGGSTSLDHFVEAGIEADRTLYESDNMTISAGPGFKYTDFQVSGSGGSEIYSVTNPRDTMDTYAPDTKTLKYRQQIPVGFLALNAQTTLGGLTLAGSVLGGASFKARSVTDDYLYDRHIENSVGISPYVGISAKASYDLNDRTSFFAAASYDAILRTRGDLVNTNTVTGNVIARDGDAASNMQTWAVSAGVKVRF